MPSLQEPRSIVDALAGPSSIVAAELRPPQAALGARAGMDAWIDTYHAVRRLTRQAGWVFLTDSAIGSREEDNLRHLVTNLGHDVPRHRIVPFLTAKHSLDYCLTYADRAVEYGFPALVVLGGDTQVGPPRCVRHAWELREQIRRRQPGLRLGGWANPHADPETQASFLADPRNTADFFLTQIVSHHQLPSVQRFLAAVLARGVTIPGMFGVFYYRSGRLQTLQSLSRFLPVPVDAIVQEFEGGATPEQACSRSLASLAGVGAGHVYVSNLPLSEAHTLVGRLAAPVGEAAPVGRSGHQGA